MLLAVIFKMDRTMTVQADHETERSRCVFPRQVRRGLDAKLGCKHEWRKRTLSNLISGLINRQMRPKGQRADRRSFAIHCLGHALYLCSQQRQRLTASFPIDKTLRSPKTKFSNEIQALGEEEKDRLGVASIGPVRNGWRVDMRTYIGGK